jgi:Tfp pilus assembly protein PilO
MNKDSSGTKILLIALPVLFAAAMLILIYFKVGQITNAATELVTEQVGLQQDKDRLGELESIKSRETQIKQEYDKALKMIPKEPMEENLIKDIQQKAVLTMADFVQIKFNPRVPVDNYTDMPLDISFSGDYAEFIKLLESLRNSERVLRLDNMTVSASQEDTSKITANITAHSFCLDGGLAQQQVTPQTTTPQQTTQQTTTPQQ